MRQRVLLLGLTAVAGFLWLAVPAHCQNQSPLDVVNEYLDLVASGNYESAAERWSATCRERADRFGISYTDIHVRVDATSPMVIKADKLGAYTTNPVQSIEAIGNEGKFVRLQYTSIFQGDLLSHWYFVNNEGGYYWICYPQDAYCGKWPVRESKYFRVHIHPDVAAFVSDAAFDQIDSFVEAVSDTLGLTKADVAEIAAKKIEFFYCDRDSTVLEITGQLTKGLLDQSSNDIISCNFPHHHEVVHLLANIKLKDVPIYTLPVVREGLAVRFGGRWGKGPAALMDLGTFLYHDSLVYIDSMLTQIGFESNSEVDLAYPVAGLIASYLWDRLGKQKYWPLYLSLSGEQHAINRLKRTEVQDALVAACGKKSWEEFRKDFDQYASDRMARSAVSAAGIPKPGKQLFSDKHNAVSIDGDWLCFKVQADSGANPHGSFFFYKNPKFGTGKSQLFDEQFQGTVPFEGYRFGVRVDQNEAGVYDYAANSLVGKFILGISGSEGYYDTTSNVVTVRFRKSLLGKQLPSTADITAVPY